jgi:FtsH-binding integral membrane protein
MEDISIWFEMLRNIALATAGLAVYSLWSVRDKLANFSLKIFIKDNKPFWIWAILLQLFMVLLVSLSPESAQALKGFIGIDFTEAGAFVTSGLMLAVAANQASALTHKNKLGKGTGDGN